MTEDRRTVMVGKHDAYPAWCHEHDDFGWLYEDGSGGCLTECVIETAGTCDLRALPAAVGRAIEKAREASPHD